MLQTMTADGNSNSHKTSDSPHYSGQIHLHLSGTFGGGTATLQFQDEENNWRNVNGGGFSSATDTIFDFRSGTTVRISLSGSTSPSLVVSLR